MKDFVKLCRKYIDSREMDGSEKRRLTYKAVLGVFERSCGGKKYTLSDIDSGVVERFKEFVRESGVSEASCSSYVRSMAFLFRRVAEQKGMDIECPFKTKGNTGVKNAPTVIPTGTLRTLKQLDLDSEPDLEFARDLYLLSFYTKGLSLYQLSTMRWADGDRTSIEYADRFCSPVRTMLPSGAAREILGRQESTTTDYILPIYSDRSKMALPDQVKFRSRKIGDSLRELSRRLRLPSALTFQSARDSWNQCAKTLGYKDPLA